MSRSRRKTPKAGITTAESEKEDKQLSHRKFRRINRRRLQVGDDLFERDRDLTNPYSMAKDGKRRFDPSKWPEGMRK